MSRRNFLKLCGLAGLGFASPIGLPSVLRAKEPAQESAGYAGPYYVVFNAEGGWDTTYLMDPKGTEDINRLYRTGDILTEGQHHFAPVAKHIGPGLSNEAFYAKYGEELRVLNGLDYSVSNHAPGARYMATGKLDSLAYPTFPALVAACHGKDAPVAFLTFGNYSGTGNLVPMSRVPHLLSLNLLAKADFAYGIPGQPIQDPFASEILERTLEEQFQARVSAGRLPRAERSQSMLYSAQVNSKALSRVVQYVPKEPSKERLGQQADIALAAFKAGVGVSANLTITQFDSHANNDPDQMKLLPEFLAGVDYLLRKAEDLKIRDKLVVIIQSEMGRTPNYNKGNGKDHWSIGSIMFLGAGIVGNRVLGATDEKLQAIPLDPKTLTSDKDKGVRVRPEHIHQALRQFAKIDEHAFSKLFPLGVPANEQLVNFWT